MLFSAPNPNFNPVPKHKPNPNLTEQESRTAAREPHDAAAVFGLKFADNIHYKFLRVAKL